MPPCFLFLNYSFGVAARRLITAASVQVRMKDKWDAPSVLYVFIRELNNFLTHYCSLMAQGCNSTKKRLPSHLMYVCDLSSVSSCSDLKLRVRILIDGTLIIFRVKPEDAGKYTCTPSNSLGISPSASAYLSVQCKCFHGNKVKGGGVGKWYSGCARRTAAAVRRLLYSLAVLLCCDEK